MGGLFSLSLLMIGIGFTGNRILASVAAFLTCECFRRISASAEFFPPWDWVSGLILLPLGWTARGMAVDATVRIRKAAQAYMHSCSAIVVALFLEENGGVGGLLDWRQPENRVLWLCILAGCIVLPGRGTSIFLRRLGPAPTKLLVR
jgi:hypothetical protein